MFRTVVIVLVAVALASLLAAVLYDVRQTLRWLAAAIFIALALAPAVALVQRLNVRGYHPPRWLAIAIPVAASIGAVVSELRRSPDQEEPGAEPEPEPAGA